MASFFQKTNLGGNPLSTPVGQLIEKATDGDQATENWGLIIETCDTVNQSDEGPKEALKAIRKRLQQNAGKNNKSVMYTLTVLETCVKNCGRRFHLQIATKDFMQELIKLIGPKYDPPQALQERVLGLIQVWAEAFKGVGELKEVVRTYQDLQVKGVEFPLPNTDSNVSLEIPAEPTSRPIQGHRPTISKSRHGSKHGTHHQQQLYATGGGQAVMAVPVQPQQPQMSPAQVIAKLRHDLNAVQVNYTVLGDMLTELTPGRESADDARLVQELNKTCRQMQTRVAELIQTVQNDEILVELLRVNDELNMVFVRFDRYDRLRLAHSGGGAVSAGVPSGSPPSDSFMSGPPIYNAVSQQTHSAPTAVAPTRALGGGEAATGNLIDFESGYSSPPPAVSALQQPSIPPRRLPPVADANRAANTASVLEGFDSLAVSRHGAGYPSVSATYGNHQLGDNPYDEIPANSAQPPTLIDKEEDYDEMEKWLQMNPKIPAPDSAATSSEFDQFLSERSRATPGGASDPFAPQPTNRTGGRKLNTEQDNSLFSL